MARILRNAIPLIVAGEKFRLLTDETRVEERMEELQGNGSASHREEARGEQKLSLE